MTVTRIPACTVAHGAAAREGLMAAIKILRKMERDYDRAGQAVKAMWAVVYRKAAERALGKLDED